MSLSNESVDSAQLYHTLRGAMRVPIRQTTLLVLAAFCGGCFLTRAPALEPFCPSSQNLNRSGLPTRPAVLDPDENTVYKAVLSNYLDANYQPHQVYLRNVSIPPHSTGALCIASEWWNDSLDFVGATENYLRANDRPYILPELRDLDPRVTMDSVSTFDDHPSFGAALLHLSRVGFSADSTIAVVALSEYRGPLWGYGVLYGLEKREGRWIVVQEALLWIS